MGGLAVAAATTEAAGKAVQPVSADMPTEVQAPSRSQNGNRELVSATACKTGEILIHAVPLLSGRPGRLCSRAVEGSSRYQGAFVEF